MADQALDEGVFCRVSVRDPSGQHEAVLTMRIARLILRQSALWVGCLPHLEPAGKSGMRDDVEEALRSRRSPLRWSGLVSDLPQPRVHTRPDVLYPHTEQHKQRLWCRYSGSLGP